MEMIFLTQRMVDFFYEQHRILFMIRDINKEFFYHKDRNKKIKNWINNRTNDEIVTHSEDEYTFHLTCPRMRMNTLHSKCIRLDIDDKI